MLIRLLYTILISLVLFPIYAQVNLVPNPGFDEFDDCPTGEANLAGYVKDWYIATSSPDYFNSCNTSFLGVPVSGSAYQVSRSGGAYMAANLYSVNNTINVPMETFQVKLKEKLRAGKKYCVEFYVNPANCSGYFIDCFDAYFSEIPLVLTNPAWGSNHVPQISNLPGNIVSDTSTWTQISGTFTAEGNEEYLILGCFKILVGIDTLLQSPIPPIPMLTGNAYYFFEDVSVIFCDGNNLEEAVVPNIITPNNDGINDLLAITYPLGYEKEPYINIYNRWGIEVYKSDRAYTEPWNAKSTFGILVSTGTYYYILHDGENTKKGFVQVAY